VDVGREAAARRDDVKAGLMTLSDYFGEQGIDWKEAVAEIAAEREFAADLGVMIGVEQAQPQAPVVEVVSAIDAPANNAPQLGSKEEPTELALPKKRKRIYRRKKQTA
jgi:capsid protein